MVSSPLLVVLSALHLLAAPGAAPTTAPDPTLDGAWVAVDAEWCAKRPPKKLIGQLKVEFRGEQVAMSDLGWAEGSGFVVGPAPATFRFTLAGPGEIDLVLPAEGAYPEVRMLGRFAFERGELKLCFQHDGKARPADFRARAKPTQMCFRLRKAPASP